MVSEAVTGINEQVTNMYALFFAAKVLPVREPRFSAEFFLKRANADGCGDVSTPLYCYAHIHIQSIA